MSGKKFKVSVWLNSPEFNIVFNCLLDNVEK